MSDHDGLLDFWFGEDKKNPLANKAMWRTQDPALDENIRGRYAPLIARAREGGLDDWKKNERGNLAYVILLDQFSRNAFRGKPEAFANDSLALEAVLRGLSAGADFRLSPVERSFFYMPLMHAEDLERQERSVQKYGVLAEAAPPELKTYLEGNLEYARRHRDIIAEFGRFPHRNAILGRPSSPVEIEFLKKRGSSF